MGSISRRDFLKITGLAAAGAGVSAVGLKGSAAAFDGSLKIAKAKETLSVCCYCAVGCGVIAHTVEGRVINVEGNPDNPINKGSLCSKGSSLSQLINHPERVKKPLYRAAGATEWQEISWDKALTEIARKVKNTRDKSFTLKNKKGETVNRTEAIASVGSAALDNEECYMYQKLLRSLGLVYIEHQARI